jgi:chemotaxis protein histidine kinase CheA
MDLLAKITGESRKEQEAARQKLLNDAQYQAKVASMGAEAGEAFANTVNGLPPGLRDVAKDIMVTGTATTEEAQKFTALMPKSAALMQKYAAITEAGGTITKEMQQELQNTMAAEGKAQKENMRTQGMYNKEMAGAYMNTVQASNIQTDAIKKGIEAQKNAKATTDGQAAALEAAKRNLAEFSNGFQMALANSGLLTTLMQAFQGLATFVQQIVVPAFQFVAPIIGQIVSTVVSLLIPAFQFLGNIVQQYIMPLLPPAIEMLSSAFSFIGGLVKDYVIPAFFTVADFIQDNFVPILAAAVTGLIAYGGWLAATKIPIALETAARYANIPALLAQAAATWAVIAPILAIAAPFIAIAAAAAGIAYYFKKMGGDLQILGDMFGWVGDTFKQVILKIKEGFYSLLNKIPGMRGDFDDDLKEIAKEQEEMDKKKEMREQRISDNMKANRESAKKAEEKKAQEREQRDKKFANMKFGAEMKGIGAKTAAEKKAIADKKEAEKSVSIDYSTPEGSAKSFFAQQKSPLVAKADAAKKVTPEAKKEAATAKAEAAKKSMEADAEAKKTQAQKKETNQKEQEKTKETVPQPTQESAETLLAQLNNNMSELLRITRENNRVAQKQLNVQEGLSGDVWANPAA